MLLAVATRERAACLRRHVGAILVADQRIIATGYNGTPTGFPNCDEGGCHRCAHPEDYAEGRGYDVCICVHAEQNALLQAAKLGYSVQGSALLHHAAALLRLPEGAVPGRGRARSATSTRGRQRAGARPRRTRHCWPRWRRTASSVERLELPEELLDLRASP